MAAVSFCSVWTQRIDGSADDEWDACEVDEGATDATGASSEGAIETCPSTDAGAEELGDGIVTGWYAEGGGGGPVGGLADVGDIVSAAGVVGMMVAVGISRRVALNGCCMQWCQERATRKSGCRKVQVAKSHRQVETQ